MATVNGLTAEHMIEIRDGIIVDAHITAGDLILVRYDDTEINVGSVIGPEGPQGDPGYTSIVVVDDEASRPTGGSLFEGLGIWQKDVNALYFWNGTSWLMPHAGLPHTSVETVDTSTVPTTSNVYIPFDHDVSITFLKKHPDSHLIATYQGAIRNDNPWGEYVVGVHVVATGFDSMFDLVKGFGDLGPKVGTAFIDGVPGGYATLSLVKKVGNGIGSVYDGQHNDNLQSLIATETF